MCRFLASLPRALVATVMVVLACADIARGQTVSGSLFGTITDPGGNRLPGVTVTVSSPQLITGQEARTSGEEGTYRFPNLPPGTYTVAFELTGFQGLNREGIILLAGQSLPVDAELKLAQVEETITVTGAEPIIDTRNSALVNIADAATLQNVPTDREFTKILNLMPGVTDARYYFAPVNNVHGGTTRQNVYSLDGINTDDPLQSVTSMMLPVDAFQEVQMNTAGISAEFGDASGAVFNFVTKSGANDFHGGANTYYQGKNTQSNNLSDDLRRQGLTVGGGFEHLYDSGVLLGGPIKRNKIWFFGNYRYTNLAERKPDFREPLTTTDGQVFAKGTVQVAPAHKAEGSFYYRDYLNFPYTETASFRNSDDARTWMGMNKKNYLFNPSWTSTLSSDTLVEARGSISIYQIYASNPNNDGSPAYQDVATGIVSGGDFHPVGDNRRNRYQVKADLSHFAGNWPGGSHNLKTGFAWEITPIREERFYQGARGPNELTGCSERCISATPDTVHLLSNERPFRVQLWNTPTHIFLENRKWNAYLQDQWVLRDRVTLNLGVRVDHVTGNLPESNAGGGFWEPQVTVFPAQDGVVDITNVAPRLGVVWDIANDHKTTIKASAGRFYAQFGGVNIRAVTPANHGWREYDWIDGNGDLVYQPGEEGLLRADTRPNLARLPRVDPNLKNQFTDVYTIGFERAFGPHWGLAVTGIFKWDGDLLGVVNEAVPFASYDPITVTSPLNQQPVQIFTLRPEFLGRPGQDVLTNPGERPGDTEPLERRYKGLEVVLRRRLQDRWQLQASYVLGKGVGNVTNQYGGSEYRDYRNPNLLINAFGDLPMGPRHQFKLYGTYLAPYGFVISGFFQTLSGIPWSENYNFNAVYVRGATTVRFYKVDFPQILSETFIDAAVQPAGTLKFPLEKLLDLRVEKKFPIGLGNLSLIADVFNVLNSNEIIRVQDLRLDNPRFGLPAEIERPRQLRMALKWEF